jgi:hypothetical protein
MNTIIVLTLTFFFSGGNIGAKVFVSAPGSTIEDCETFKQAAIEVITGKEIQSDDGTKATVLYVDGLCRVVTQGNNA